LPFQKVSELHHEVKSRCAERETALPPKRRASVRLHQASIESEKELDHEKHEMTRKKERTASGSMAALRLTMPHTTLHWGRGCPHSHCPVFFDGFSAECDSGLPTCVLAADSVTFMQNGHGCYR